MIYSKALLKFIVPRHIFALCIVIFSLNTSVAFALPDTPTIKKLMEHGISLLVKQSTSEAIATFNQVLLLSPDHANAHFRLGQAYIQQRQLSKGFEYLEKSTELDPRNVGFSLYLSNLYERQKKFDKAMDEYQRIMDTGTHDGLIKEVEKHAALATGREFARKNELDAALLIFGGLRLEFPKDPLVLYNIGNTYLQAKRINDAELAFKELIEVEPTNEVVNMTLAMIYERSKRPQLAIQRLQIVINQGKNSKLKKEASVQYHSILGRENMNNKNWIGGRSEFQAVVALEPKNTEALFNIARANLQLRNRQMAENGFLKVLDINPDNFVARMSLSRLYFDTGKIEAAKEQLTYVIENDKSGRYAQQAKLGLNMLHTLIADQALQSGDIGQSLEEYKKALDYDSANTKASFNRGIIFVQQKKFAEARIEFESVLRHEPENLRARLNLALVFEELKLFNEASGQYEIILQSGTETEEGRFATVKWKIAKARGLWSDKQLGEAEKVFEEVAKEQPRNFQVFVFLGIIQSSKGKLRDAAKSYQRALSLQPTNYAVKLLLGRVYEQQGLESLAATEYRSILFAGGNIPQVPEAEARLARVESRLSGFSNSLTYQYVYDSNLNMDDQSPFEEVRSDLALSFIYAMKTRDDLGFSLNWSPTYSNFHLNQIDYLRSVLTSDARFGSPDDNWSIAFSRQDQDSLVNAQTVSQATSLNIGRGKKLFAKAFLYMTPEAFEGEKVSTSVRGNFGLRYIRSLSGVANESLTGSFSVSFQQALRWGIGMNIGYTFSLFRNLSHITQNRQATFTTDPISGTPEPVRVTADVLTYDSNDYEYNGHRGSFNLQKVLAPGLVGSLGFVGSLNTYVNKDSGAVARQQFRNRVNLMVGLNPSLSYSFYKDLRFVLRGSFQKNLSSMPVGFSASAGREGEDAIASFQSNSLGKYTRFTVETGISMSF